MTIILTDDQLTKLHEETAHLTEEAERLLAAAEISDDLDDWDAWKEADGIAAGHALAIQSMTDDSDKLLTAMKGHAEHLDARVDAMWQIFHSLNFGDEHVDDSYRAEGRAEGYAAALRHIEDGMTPSVRHRFPRYPMSRSMSGGRRSGRWPIRTATIQTPPLADISSIPPDLRSRHWLKRMPIASGRSSQALMTALSSGVDSARRMPLATSSRITVPISSNPSSIPSTSPSDRSSVQARRWQQHRVSERRIVRRCR